MRNKILYCGGGGAINRSLAGRARLPFPALRMPSFATHHAAYEMHPRNTDPRNTAQEIPPKKYRPRNTAQEIPPKKY
jgi:hypothetical protein